MAQKNKICVICGTMADFVFSKNILKKNKVAYFLCPTCDLLQTETPYWLDEAYARPITLQDTGILVRNVQLARSLSLFLHDAGLRGGRFLDYAGGYGVLTRLMRDIGFDYYWNDTYTQNLFAVGFEADLEGEYDAISAFEVLEHLCDPLQKIRKALSTTDTFIFSTELKDKATVPSAEWIYYGFSHGQHISFYSRITLEYIASVTNTRLLSDGRFFHVLTRRLRPKSFWVSGKIAQLRMAILRWRMTSLTLADSRSFN